uniref:HPt domain-containing protein n=1 Tax=Spongospora subterranea TaxID=70186 RepID=A0A0H5QJV7_9EUKA|eukprot:CRZ01616.1 hypothetical protein [Spongospora subterranea]
MGCATSKSQINATTDDSENPRVTIVVSPNPPFLDESDQIYPLPPVPVPSVPNDTNGEAITSGVTLKEAPVLDLKFALEQVGDDRSFLRELINDTLDEKDMRLQGLTSAVQAADPNAFRIIAHTIKGAALNVGLKALGETAKQLDNFSGSATPEMLTMKGPDLIAQLSSEYHRIEAISDADLL